MAKKKESKTKKKLLAWLLIIILLCVIFAYTQTRKIETMPLKEIVKNPQKFENKSVVIEGIVSFEISSNILAYNPVNPYFIVGPENERICANGFGQYENQYLIANVTYAKGCVTLISILGKKDCLNLYSEEFENYSLLSSEENKVIWTRSGKYYCP